MQLTNRTGTTNSYKETSQFHGAFVFFLTHTLRAAIVWIMMPAALWSGMQVPECVCESGEHRFFCGKMFGATNTAMSAAPKKSPTSCCDASRGQERSRSCCSNKAVADDSSGVASSATAKPCGRCEAVPNAPLKSVERVKVPAPEQTVCLLLSPSLDAALSALHTSRDFDRPFTDQLPVTDRVIAFRRLLI